jgi:hypothetical protein
MLPITQTKLRQEQIMKREIHDINIDFDEASREWIKNKNVLKNGMFSYKKTKKNCCHYDKDGTKCRKKQIINSESCEYHFTSSTFM